MSEFKRLFGARVQELRSSNGLKQDQLAEMINISTRNLSKIETGQNFPSSENLEKLIDALKVEPKELFNFEQHKSSDELLKEILIDIEHNKDKIKDIYKILKALIS